MQYGMLEYDLKGNAFRLILNKGTIMVAQGDEARELVLEVPEKPVAGREVFGIVKVQFYQQMADRFYKSLAKGAVGFGVVTKG